MTIHGGICNKTQVIPTPGYNVDEGVVEWVTLSTVFCFLKKERPKKFLEFVASYTHVYLFHLERVKELAKNY